MTDADIKGAIDALGVKPSAGTGTRGSGASATDACGSLPRDLDSARPSRPARVPAMDSRTSDFERRFPGGLRGCSETDPNRKRETPHDLKTGKNGAGGIKKGSAAGYFSGGDRGSRHRRSTEGPPHTSRRARTALIGEREIALADSVASIEKARGNEGRRTAAALAAGRAAPSDDLMRSARANALEAEDRLVAAQTAVQRLEEELAQAEEEVRRRRQTVSVHVGKILAAEAGRLLQRAYGIEKRAR